MEPPTALSLASCAAAEETVVAATDLSDSEKVLTWHNWAAYMDEDDDGNYPTLLRFQEQSGITVDYRIEIDDNDTWYAKVKDQLELGQDIGADVACPTTWMAARLRGSWIPSGDGQRKHAKQSCEPSSWLPGQPG